MSRKTLTTAFAATLLATTLTACATNGEAAPGTSPAAPVSAATQPSEAPADTPTLPEVDEFSEVIDGVAYKGTPDAPSRIGTDTPGEIPQVQKDLSDGEIVDTLKMTAKWIGENPWDWVAENMKYRVMLVRVSSEDWTLSNPEPPTWTYRIEAPNEEGKWVTLKTDVGKGKKWTKKQVTTALKEGVTLDGRVLNRAEYVIAYDF